MVLTSPAFDRLLRASFRADPTRITSRLLQEREIVGEIV